MRISILIAIEGIGRLHRRFHRRCMIGLQHFGRYRLLKTGGRHFSGARNGRPLLLFGWIHSLSVMLGR